MHISLLLNILTTPYLADGTPNSHFIDREDGHVDLLEYCLTYLSFIERDLTSDVEVNDPEDSFLEYATFQWSVHAKANRGQDEISRTRNFISQSSRKYGIHSMVSLLGERVRSESTSDPAKYAFWFVLRRIVQPSLRRPKL